MADRKQDLLSGIQSVPKISVVMPTFNRAVTLRNSLRSIFESSYPNLEVIVVDGGSRDGTVEVLESFEPKLTRWISEPDQGEYWALNKAVRMSSGEIVKPMTDDDVLLPGALELAAQEFTRDATLDILFGSCIFRSTSAGNEDAVWRSPPNSRHCNLRGILRGYRGFPNSLTAFIRRSVFDAAGLFDPAYSCGDTEFWARCLAGGLNVRLYEKDIVEYILTGSNGILTKGWRLSMDHARAARKYGDLSDVGWFWALRLPGLVCNLLGWHPRRALSRLRYGVAAVPKPMENARSNAEAAF